MKENIQNMYENYHKLGGNGKVTTLVKEIYKMPNEKNIVKRNKTFIQGFLRSLVVALPNSNLSDSLVIKSLLIGAVAAAISMVMN